MLGIQRALSLIYPDQCVLCPELVEASGGLCANCWREMPFIRGLACATCGVPLPGQGDDTPSHCDDCLVLDRPWEAGRAALVYRDAARRLVLKLKHGDRPDLAEPAVGWLQAAGQDLFREDTVLVPVPIHWSRMIRRKFNQSAELTRALADHTGLGNCPDALIRTRRTTTQAGKTVDARFANLHDAISANPKRTQTIKGRNVCLIDDVMTSGATLSVSTSACLAAGARRVDVLVLARTEKAP